MQGCRRECALRDVSVQAWATGSVSDGPSEGGDVGEKDVERGSRSQLSMNRMPHAVSIKGDSPCRCGPARVRKYYSKMSSSDCVPRGAVKIVEAPRKQLQWKPFTHRQGAEAPMALAIDGSITFA